MAAGMDGLSFSQRILLSEIAAPTPTASRIKNYVSPSVRQDYETQLLPSGLLWQFTFHSTWGDPYYIGLDGLELFDAEGQKLILDATQVVFDACSREKCSSFKLSRVVAVDLS